MTVSKTTNNINSPNVEALNLKEYQGEKNDLNQRHGQGFQKWNKDVQKYYGKFLYNNLHGEGKYSYITPKNSFIYEGSFYSNKFDGYGRVIADNCTYFEGLYKDNKRFGPGVLSHPDGHQDVGLWYDRHIVRLSCVVLPQWIPTLGKSQIAKIKLLKYRKLVPLTKKYDGAFNALQKLSGNDDFATKHSNLLYNNTLRNATSAFFNKPLYGQQYFGANECYIDIALTSQEELETISKNSSSLEMNEGVSSASVEIAIEALTKNIDRLLDCTPEELDLIRTKCCILRKLILQDMERKPCEDVAMPQATKKVLVDELLAWNNEDLSVAMLKHTFQHRNRESIVRFNISKLLSGDRDHFGAPSTYECACIAFLNNCSLGRHKEMYNLMRQFDLNPDLCDSHGNAAVMYAASRDRVCLIKQLCDFGANLDVQNDEGLTPLTTCLARYLMIKNGVSDWEIAFLGNTQMKTKDKRAVKQWCPRASLLSLMTTQLPIINEKSVFFKDENLFMAYDCKNLRIKCNVAWLLNLLGAPLPSEELQNFQKEYLNSPETLNKERFLLDTGPVKPVTKSVGKKQKKKDKVASKRKREKSVSTKTSNKKRKSVLQLPEVTAPIVVMDPAQVEMENKLKVVYNTILVLLHCGADPNIGEVPLPALMLSMFIGDANLIEKLLENGANPDATTIDDNMTTLHLLMTQPATLDMINVCNILIKYGANPNARTNQYHWLDEDQSIVGNLTSNKEESIEGKTPLHVLGMRMDYELDPNGYLNMVADVLIQNGARLDEKYLCHTPLTLAMLKGNVKLVRTLLQNGDNPNQALDGEMGVPLTLYVLKRFSGCIPEVRVCQEIMGVLVEYFGNPLMSVANFGNAVEFMVAEHVVNTAPSKKRKKNEKKSKKGAKVKSTPQNEVKGFLQKLSRNTAFKNYQSKALLTIFNTIMDDNLKKEGAYCNDLAKLLTVQDAARILRVLNRQSFFKVNPITQFAYQFKTLEYIHTHIAKKRSDKSVKAKKGSSEASTTPTPAELIVDILKNPLPKLKMAFKEPEADKDEAKYTLCYYCCLRTDKLLLPCPKCGLVYFCSEECNKLSIKEGSQHPCNVLFYNKEKERYDACLKSGIPYVAVRTPLSLKQAQANIKMAGEKIEQNPQLYQDAIDAFLRGGGAFGDEHKGVSRVSKGGTRYNMDGSRKSVGGTLYSREGGRISKGGTEYSKSGGRISKGGTEYTKSGGRISKGGTEYSKTGEIISKRTKSGGRISKGGTEYSKSGGRISKGGTEYTKDGGRISKGGTRYSKGGTPDASSKRGIDAEDGIAKGKKGKSQIGEKSDKGGKGKNADGSVKKTGTKGGDGSKAKKTRKGGDDKTTKNRSSLKDLRQRKTRSKRSIAFKDDADHAGGGQGGASKSTTSLRSRSKSRDSARGKCANKDYLSTVLGRLPNKYQYFMQQLALLFPDFDFTTLCFPFVCFTNGQLYYRFLDKKPLFCETYTNV